MKRKLLVVVAAIAILGMLSGIAMAHHGVAGYDMTKTVTLHGTVAKFDWSNPHVVVYVDAKNDSGFILKAVVNGEALPSHVD
jgi:hypothetical protein